MAIMNDERGDGVERASGRVAQDQGDSEPVGHTAKSAPSPGSLANMSADELLAQRHVERDDADTRDLDAVMRGICERIYRNGRPAKPKRWWTPWRT